jgi:hypothetical protein
VENPHYTTSWGGPTLAGAWAVHAGLALVTIYPVLAWAIRGLVRLSFLDGGRFEHPGLHERAVIMESDDAVVS